MKKISIIGCGWLGKPLSLELSKEYKVECFSRELTSDNSPFWQNDIIIIAINTKDNYLQTLQKIASLSKKEATLIILSSISVYREFDCTVDESAKITKSSLQKEAEELLLSLEPDALILRLGGLMGDDRVAGKWKNNSLFSDGFVNYIHKDDVINIIKTVIQQDKKSDILNLVAPNHPTRAEIHKKNSEKFGFEMGAFEGFTNRKVISKKLIKELSYTFLHPNPLEFWG